MEQTQEPELFSEGGSGCYPMESWYELSTKDLTVADRFESAWSSKGGPRNAALLAAYDPHTRTMHFYFSAAAARLLPDVISRYGATECAFCNVEELVFVSGDDPASHPHADRVSDGLCFVESSKV